MGLDRIAKRIAHLGYCSRRDAERLIVAKEVKVNGVLIDHPAFLVSHSDKIEVEGNLLNSNIKNKLYAYYKPVGLVCSTNDDMGRGTIYDDLSVNYDNLGRLVYVGRLDISSEGLLLLTNAPTLADKLTSSDNGIKRVYKVRAFGSVSQNDLESLAMGITIDGVYYKPILANLLSSRGANCWIEFSITEGKNREIRKICDYLGLSVNRLIRTSFGPYKLEGMKPGELREVDTAILTKNLK